MSFEQLNTSNLTSQYIHMVSQNSYRWTGSNV